jgi:hypothetical protein
LNSLEIFSRPPETDNVIFLCHACSDLKCQSGEACVIIAPEEEKKNILRGEMECLRGYEVGTGKLIEDFEREEGYLPLFVPDFLGFETDFYLVASDEAARNYKKIMTSQLWDVNCGVFDISKEKREAEKQYLERRAERAKKWNEFVLRQAIKEAHAITTLSKPCTLETDPIRAGCQV